MSVMSLSRRRLTAVAAVGVLLAASACGSDDGAGGDGGGGATDWWHIQTDTALTPVWEEFATDFEAANEGATINITPLENDAFKSRLTTSMQSGDPPDLFQSWGGGVLRQQVAAGLVRDLTTDLAPVIETIAPHALAPYTIDGKVYGIPWDMGMTGFWYNKAMFADAGIEAPPATWQEFLDAVAALQAADVTPLALGEGDLWPGHFYWGYLATRVAGTDGFAQATEARSFDSPDFVRAGQLLAELVALDPFQEGFLAAGFGTPDGQAAAIANGRAAMSLMGQWAPTVQADNAENGEGLGDDLGWFPFPAVEGGKGNEAAFGGGNGISVGINAPDSAVDFLGYIMENYDTILEADGALVSVAVDAAPPADALPAQMALLEALQATQGFQLYLDQDLPPSVGSEVNESVGALFAEEATPEDVVANITAEFQRAPEL